MKRIGWILAGAVLVALVFGIEPSAANAATSPANARTASLPGLHLTSARAMHGATAPVSRPARRSPARHASGRAHPGSAPSGHRALTRLNRHPHGRWNGHAAAATASDRIYDMNSTIHVETALLRAPRQRYTPVPETRGPPRASPSIRIRPHLSLARVPERSTSLGRAPSPSKPNLLTVSNPSPSLRGFVPCSITSENDCRVRRIRRPHACRLEGPAARNSWPSGESSS